MEAEKEKNPSEKSDPNDGNETETNVDDNKNKDQDLNQSNDSHDPSSSSDQPPLQAESNNGDVTGDGDETTGAPIVEEEHTPVTPDLVNVSEKVDQFISSLSSTSKCGDGEGSSLPEIDESVEQFAFLVEAKLLDFESASKKWSQLTEEESSSFLESVDRTSKLFKSLSGFSSDEKYEAAINRLSAILERGISIMEVEFKMILEDYQTSHDRDQMQKTEEAKTKQLSSSSSNVHEVNQPELPESESKPDEDDSFLGYSDVVVINLNKLARAIIQGGHETECCEMYFFIRRNAIEQSLHKLRFEKFCIDEVQKMHWEPLEREIAAWIKTFKEFAASLLPSERRLAEAVFSGGDDTSISDGLFGSLSKDLLFNLLNFAEAVSMTKRSAEKLFKFLDLYETLRDRIPEMEKLFSADCLDHLKSEASLTRTRLGEAIYNIFGELENSIKADTAKTPVPGGAVHPLTRYTMNYLKYACEYRDTLEQVFMEHKKIDRADSATGSDYDHEQHKRGSQQQAPKASPFQVQLGKVMDLLDANLGEKSKLYKDPSLSLIFMMNNGRYILQKIKGSGEINSLMGDTWVRKRSSDLRSYHTNYKRETWTKLLQCLNHEGLNVNGKVVKPVLKERFKSFNAMFDEIHRTQSTWVVSDEQLQSELRVSISAIVIPAYRSFMGRFSQIFTPGRQTEKYIKYQPEDIETCIDELFDGPAAAQQGKRR